MNKDNKIMIAIGVITIAIIGLGAYFLSRPPKTEQTNPEKVNQEVLIRSDSHKIKAPQEKAVLVEFGDFQCPACGSYFALTEKLKEEFKDNLTFVFRNYPLMQHKYGKVSSYAAEAAGKQGKFWEMYTLLYKNQDTWSLSSDGEAVFRDYAKSLGVDLKKYDEDVKSGEVKKIVDNDSADGSVLGVNSTPTFYLNGEKLSSIKSYEDFQILVKAAILKNPISISGTEEKYHAHFDFKMVVNAKTIDFSNDKYQESESNKLNPDVHFHDGNGKVAHLHKKGVKLVDFTNSMKFVLNNECLTLDTGTKYCTGNGKTLKMFVNGKENKEFESYVPQDLDRILITYGSEGITLLQKQIDSVSNDSCIYSEKCPERGKPPTENCVGGLGSGCDEE